MNRFSTLFQHLSRQKQGAFVPFVTLCDPTFDRSFEIICTLVENGADALELGFPFSDPLLDGPVIQAANHRALSSGANTAQCFQLLAKIRTRYPDIPISLLLCANLIYAQTLEKFYQTCQDVGVDAVLIADVPLLACEPYRQMAKAYGIQPVFICPPNADEQTLQTLARYSEGYLYLVSRAGITSAENQQSATNLGELVQQLKSYGSPPILQGFGIATPKQVGIALLLGVDGVISGSAIVKIIEQHLANQSVLLSKLAEFVTQMKQATYQL